MDRLVRCRICSPCEPLMPRRSWPSKRRIAATSRLRSPTAATSTSSDSPSGTTPCLPSRRPASARITCLSTKTDQCSAGSTCGSCRKVLPGWVTASLSMSPAVPLRPRTVRNICLLAASRHGVSTLRAATSRGNVASQRVLVNAGFLPVGQADPKDLAGNRAPGISGTSLSGQRVTPETTPRKSARAAATWLGSEVRLSAACRAPAEPQRGNKN